MITYDVAGPFICEYFTNISCALFLKDADPESLADLEPARSAILL